jgi:uncharacterized membrane protein YsdA (DUF1294 family)
MNWAYAVIVIAAWNIVVLAMYGFDKRRAKHGGWRISEKALLLSAALMGGTGALIGMLIFHHKTRHAKFRIGVPLLLIVNIALVGIALRMLDI